MAVERHQHCSCLKRNKKTHCGLPVLRHCCGESQYTKPSWGVGVQGQTARRTSGRMSKAVKALGARARQVFPNASPTQIPKPRPIHNNPQSTSTTHPHRFRTTNPQSPRLGSYNLQKSPFFPYRVIPLSVPASLDQTCRRHELGLSGCTELQGY